MPPPSRRIGENLVLRGSLPPDVPDPEECSLERIEREPVPRVGVDLLHAMLDVDTSDQHTVMPSDRAHEVDTGADLTGVIGMNG